MRFPAGVPYQGPTANYDEQIETDALIQRLVYGIAAPLLGHRQRITVAVIRRLMEEMANSHVVVIAVHRKWDGAASVRRRLRPYVPDDVVELTTEYVATVGAYVTFARNVVDARMVAETVGEITVARQRAARGERPRSPRSEPLKITPGVRSPDDLIGHSEIARCLNVPSRHVRRLLIEHTEGIEVVRRGAGEWRYIYRRDLPILASRSRIVRKRAGRTDLWRRAAL